MDRYGRKTTAQPKRRKEKDPEELPEDDEESSQTSLSSSETSLSESEEIIDSESEVEEIPTGEATKRLAVVGLVWEVFRAKDLWAIFSSFLPPQGVLLSVKIYPSDFGLKEMESERLNGPPAFLFEKKEQQEEEAERLRAVRKYEKSKRKYYFGVVECDTIQTANTLYTTLNGTQVEKSSKLDLRFIDDDLDFTGREIKSECLEAPTKYVPVSDFLQSDSLNISKPTLDWDETDKYRTLLTQRKFSTQELNEMDFRAFLESASSESDDDENISKYRALLMGGSGSGGSGSEEEEEREGDDDESMEEPPAPVVSKKSSKSSKKEEDSDEQGDKELTFTAGLKSKTAELIQRKVEGDDNKTVFERKMEKERERKKARKEELKQKKVGIATKQDDDEADPWADFDKELELDTQQKLKKNKKNKKKKLTEEEKRQHAELELLTLDPTKQDKEAIETPPLRKKAMKKLQKEKEQIESKQVAEQVMADERFLPALVKDPRFAIDPTRKTTGGKKDPSTLAAAIREEKAKKPQQKGGEKDDSEMKGMIANLKANFNRPQKR